MIKHTAELLAPSLTLPSELERVELTMSAPIVPEAWAEHPLPPELLSRLEEINSTWRIIHDPLSDTAFEVAEVNTNQPMDGVLDNSTFSSSLSGNLGNAFEFAYRGTATPGERRIYVATMGNGGSDNFSKKELKYLRQSGRLTDEVEGKTIALPTIQALRRALEFEGWQPSKMSADSFGGNIATALMADFEPDQINHVYIKGRPNISQHSPIKLAHDMLITENMKNSKVNYETSSDPWKMSSWILEETKRHLPRVYGVEVKHRGNIARQLGSYLLGLSIGPLPNQPQTSPAFIDTRAALERQPSALATFEFPNRDVLYKSKADYEKFIVAIGKAARSNVQGVVTPGTHGGHAYSPNARAASERYAFSRQS